MRCAESLQNNSERAVKLKYRRFVRGNGSLPPLIILHDIISCKESWYTFAATITQRTCRAVYALDARNHGHSPHTSSHNIDAMISDILKFLAEKNITIASFLGHGMGGYVMMKLALMNPDMVEHLFIINSSPISISDEIDEIYKTFGVLMTSEISVGLNLTIARKLMRQQLRKVVKSNSRIELILFQMQKDEISQVYSWLFNTLVVHESITEYKHFHEDIRNLPPFPGSTHFICGNFSNIVHPDHWSDIKKLFPKANSIWLNSGHMMHVDKVSLVVDVVSLCLRDLQFKALITH